MILTAVFESTDSPAGTADATEVSTTADDVSIKRNTGNAPFKSGDAVNAAVIVIESLATFPKNLTNTVADVAV